DVVVAGAEELDELEIGRRAEELAAHAPRQPEIVLGVAGGLDELRRPRIGHHQLEAGRRHRLRHRQDHLGLPGREQDLLGHGALLHGCASGIVAVTTGSWLTTRVVWPWPVVSSTSRASPGPNTCLEPSPSPLSSRPDRMMTNFRHGAGCKSRKRPTGLTLIEICVVGRTLSQSAFFLMSIGSLRPWPSGPV